MQIYVISIETENSPRLMNFIGQSFFKDPTVNYQKIGIKGADLTTKDYFELAVKGRSQSLSPGEVGCTLSHIEALKQFLVSGDDYALILEDDAILPQKLTLANLENEVKAVNLPSNIILSLGGIQMKECRKVRGVYKETLFFKKTVLEVVPDFYHRVCYTVAYIVDQAMAQTLINYHSMLRRADDWSYLFDFDSNAHIYMTYLVDHPVIEAGEKNQQLSTIEAERELKKDLAQSQFGANIRRNFAKILYKKYKIDG